jgi:hypothetical protein
VSAPLRLDPSLPALALAFETEYVSSQLEAVSRAAKGARLRVAPTPLDVRYEPGARCVVTYALANEGGKEETIGVLEVDPAGITGRLFDDDPALPELALAADAEMMRPRLAALPDLASGQPIEGCVVTPSRYKPGVSCVLRYILATSVGDQVVIGKLLPGRARHLARAVETLDGARRIAPVMPRVPPLVALWPELHLVLQFAVDGTSLGTTLLNRETTAQTRTELVRRGGVALAALHLHADAPEPRRGLDDDIAELRHYRPLFGHLAPELAARYDRELAALARLAQQLPEPKAVASHGALRAGHYLVHGPDVVLIDLDGFCAANPARDVGNMLAYLDWLAIRRARAARIAAEAARDFIAGYEALATLPPAWLQVYKAVSMLKIAGRRLRRLSFEEWDLLPELLGRARSSLATLVR